VVLEWPLGFVSNDFYNIHRATSVAEIDKAAYTAPILNGRAVAAGSFTDPGAVSSPPDLYLYEVYGRECTGASVIP